MKISNINQPTIAVVGLGYVGLPLAVAFGTDYKVIGFDIDNDKINGYKNGIDITNEIGNELQSANIFFTNNEKELSSSDYVIIAVPTPIDQNNKPNLRPLCEASKIVGRNMKSGTVVVYESTVYPGVTEEICIPILENISHLKSGSEFKVGFSPERINPGDKVHKLENIIKIVSGQDDETLNIVANLYGKIIKAGVYLAPNIKVAEAAKILENSQRGINIAFMNEMAMLFHSMEIDTFEVLKAANTKWNYLNFLPGLVGGHCIGVDPYYLLFKGKETGVYPKLLDAACEINNDMGNYFAEMIVKRLKSNGSVVRDSKILVLGFTFKEDVNDIRNTKVFDIVSYLKKLGVQVFVCDPLANADEVFEEYGINIVQLDDVHSVDAIVVAVAHDVYKQLSADWFKNKFKNEQGVLFDIKGAMDKTSIEKTGVVYYGI